MKRLRRKLRSNGGETLVELLVSILIGTLAITILMTGVAAAGRMERNAHQADERFYEALSAAEGQTSAAQSATVEVRESGRLPVTIEVDLYGSDGLYSYCLGQNGGDSP
jgi:type II secretory pathway pseudopilin PulG